MWKTLFFVMVAVWIGSQIIMATFGAWAIEKSLSKRDQGKKEQYYYWLKRVTIIDYKVPGREAFRKEDILGAYPDKETAIAAMHKEIEYAKEALGGLTSQKPYEFDYSKWNMVELYLDNNQFKEKQTYSIHAF